MFKKRTFDSIMSVFTKTANKLKVYMEQKGIEALDLEEKATAACVEEDKAYAALLKLNDLLGPLDKA